MPTYEYDCPACGTVEAFQSMKDAALTTCPACAKHPVTRAVSRGAGVIFKGGGFYQTDYRGGDYAAKAKADSTPAAGPSCGASGCPGVNACAAPPTAN